MAQKPLATAVNLLVIGGSAGSLDVLIKVLPALNIADHFAIVIVLHRKADGESQLTDLLGAKSRWPVMEATDKEVIAPRNIYLAPADYHLLVEADLTFSLDYSEKINYSRPSIDATFETAAIAYKEQLICLLLSGANTDGTNGLIAAQKEGAKVFIQQPASAIAPFMPQHALDVLTADAVMSPEQMIEQLDGLLAVR